MSGELYLELMAIHGGYVEALVGMAVSSELAHG